MRVVPLDDEQGHVALGLALRHLDNVGIFMHTTAHPDDENNGAAGDAESRARATARRWRRRRAARRAERDRPGDVRGARRAADRASCAALHRFDGAEQYFTRAVDFGYSFSVDETFEKWGRDEITADYVRLIRTIRPDVIVTLPPTATPAASITWRRRVITRDALQARRRSDEVPRADQGRAAPVAAEEALSQRRLRLPRRAAAAGPGARASTPASYDPLLGKTYDEIGTEARSMHKCQGMGQLLSLPAPARRPRRTSSSRRRCRRRCRRTRRRSSTASTAASLSLAKFAGARVPKDLTEGLTAITNAVADRAEGLRHRRTTKRR